MLRIGKLELRTAHPFFFSAFWVLRGFHQIQEFASFNELLLALLLLQIVVFAVVQLIELFVRDQSKSAMIASIFLIVFLFYGELQVAILRIGWIQLSRYRYLLTITIASAAILIWRALKTRKSLANLSLYLTIVSFIYVLIEIVNICSYKNPLRDYNYLTDQTGATTPEIPSRPRDIYYIILDSYTSQESLREFWNYDNSSFINHLKGRGFHIVEHSRSNYNWTIYSIASSLNMSYINVPTAWVPNFNYRVLPMRDLIRNSRVVRAIQSMGYEIINLSLFDLFDHEKFYSYPLPDRHHLFRISLMRKTVIGTMIDNLHLNIDPQTPINVDHFLQKISMQKTSRPRFVYAHYMIPHSPYFFDSEGNLRPFRSRIGKPSEEVNQQLYLEQLSFTNKVMQQTVDLILKNSAVQPIIILQGDHGSACFRGSNGQKEATTILNALYLPEIDRSTIQKDLTPVNSFRLIFDSYFATNHGFLPNRVFVVTGDPLNVIVKQ